MRVFVITRTPEKLVIKRSRTGLIVSRLSTILLMIGITLSLAFIWSSSIDLVANKTLRFIIMSVVIFLVCFAVFFKNLFEKPVIITLAGGVFSIHNKSITGINAIEAILVENHVTADTGTTMHVKIAIPGRKISIASGIPASELDELLQNLLFFPGLEKTKVKETIQ